MDLANNLAKEGIAFASVRHRLGPAIWRDSSLNTGIKHPKHIEDVAAAVKWLYENFSKYGYDRENIFIGGFSSGGHLAALISLDSTHLNKYGLSTRVFKGVLPISGTYDIPNYYDVLSSGNRPELGDLHVKAVFGDSENDFLIASPTNYLQNLTHPFLIMCDNSLYNYTKLFEEKIIETGFRNVRVVYSYHLSHGELWRNMSGNEHRIYRNIMVDFIKGIAVGG